MGDLRQLLIHLRFPFSFFLLPIFLFAWAHSMPVEANVWPLFIILHLIVYPSSNGFNSLMDQDTESIGGIEHPQPVPAAMSWLTIALDTLALFLAWWAYSPDVLFMLALYILASRAYSHRKVRLKKYPVLGYLVVVTFQGALIFLLTASALAAQVSLDASVLLGMGVSAAMIGASYPLTQVYQHQQDIRDGVRTLSYVLGVRGTFIYAGVLFIIFNALALCYFIVHLGEWKWMLLLLAVTAPAGWFLTKWSSQVWKDKQAANYQNAMMMSKIGSVCMNVMFLTLLIVTILTHTS